MREQACVRRRQPAGRCDGVRRNFGAARPPFPRRPLGRVPHSVPASLCCVLTTPPGAHPGLRQLQGTLGGGARCPCRRPSGGPRRPQARGRRGRAGRCTKAGRQAGWVRYAQTSKAAPCMRHGALNRRHVTCAPTAIRYTLQNRYANATPFLPSTFVPQPPRWPPLPPPPAAVSWPPPTPARWRRSWACSCRWVGRRGQVGDTGWGKQAVTWLH